MVPFDAFPFPLISGSVLGNRRNNIANVNGHLDFENATLSMTEIIVDRTLLHRD